MIFFEEKDTVLGVRVSMELCHGCTRHDGLLWGSPPPRLCDSLCPSVSLAIPLCPRSNNGQCTYVYSPQNGKTMLNVTMNGRPYEFDFEAMLQTNKQLNTTRKLRFVEKEEEE